MTRPGFTEEAWAFVLDAFGYAQSPRFYAATVPLSELAADVTPDMVARGVWVDDSGVGDEEPDIAYVAELVDGRFVYATAGCDYTGWDCRSGAEYFVGALEQVVRHMEPETRAAFLAREEA